MSKGHNNRRQRQLQFALRNCNHHNLHHEYNNNDDNGDDNDDADHNNNSIYFYHHHHDTCNYKHGCHRGDFTCNRCNYNRTCYVNRGHGKDNSITNNANNDDGGGDDGRT